MFFQIKLYSNISDDRSTRRKVKSLTEHDLSAAEKSLKRWSNVEDGNKVNQTTINC